MAKVVLDANVIISAAFGGNPLKAVIQAMKNDEVYLSRSIAMELTDVFPTLAKKLTDEQLAFLQQRIRDLIRMAKMATVRAAVSLSRDPKDDHYLALCKEVSADFLITGDKDLLAIPRVKLTENGISCEILTPQDFVKKTARDADLTKRP